MSSDNVDGVATAQGASVQVGDRAQYTELAQEGQKARWIESDSDARWVAEEDERPLFDQMYAEQVIGYYKDALGTNAQGRQVLRLMTKWKPIVAAFVRNALHNTEQIDNALDATLDWEPEGRGEAYVRPLREDSFEQSTYVNTPDDTGAYPIIVNETATRNQQAWIILGYLDYFAGGQVGYDYVQERVDDSIGVRRELPTRVATETADSLAVIERDRGPLPIFPGDTVTSAINVYQSNIKTGLWPIGVEVIVESAQEAGGVLDGLTGPTPTGPTPT
jgi:hypothetical protein